MNLNGEWDFKFAINPDEAPNDFYKGKVIGWNKMSCPFQLANERIR